MEHENNIDRQSLASISPGQGGGGFRLYDTHAAGRLHFGSAGGRPNLEMLDQLARAIPRWSKEAITYCVLLEGNDPFCAGWDLEALLAGDAAAARHTLAQSYTMAWQLECFTKPGIALIDGLVAGAGAAFTLYGTHRVGGERYRFSVPGPRQGWFPDHGLSHALAQLPGNIGTYLALTGAELGRADAYRLGLLTQCIPAAAFAGIATRLSDADPVDPILDGLDERPRAGALDPYAEVIAHCFSADSIEEILARLAGVKGRERDWALAANASVAAAPRLAAALTLAILRENRHGDLRDALIRDYRVASRLVAHEDRLARDTAVTAQMLAHLRASLETGDLSLSTRAEMQAPAL